MTTKFHFKNKKMDELSDSALETAIATTEDDVIARSIVLNGATAEDGLHADLIDLLRSLEEERDYRESVAL